MAKARKLGARQLAVIEELFSGELGEPAVLEKYKVSRKLYNKWLADELFIERFERRIAEAYRQTSALIARYAPLAAAKLVQLTECEKEETARKACLDIIQSDPRLRGQDPRLQTQEPRDKTQLPPQTASKLLAALAEEKNGQ